MAGLTNFLHRAGAVSSSLMISISSGDRHRAQRGPQRLQLQLDRLFLAAVQDGFGIGMVPTFYKFVAPDLVTLSIVPECVTELWLCWHEATKTRAKVRAVTAFLRARFLRDRARWFS